MVNQLNVMVAATIPGSPVSSTPSSPQSGSSSSFEPEYLPPSRGKRNKAAASPRTNKKARRQNKLQVASSPNSVELTEDELLTWTSEDYARHVSAIADRRRLTDKEEQIVKDQKRRIKNRESAQESRERRRAQLEQLQEEVAELRSEKSALADENARLREQVERLQGTVRQFDGLRNMWNTWTSRKTANSGAVKAAGMCLLVVLFSFGLLFNQHHSSVTGPRFSLFDRTPSIETKLLRDTLVPTIGEPPIAAPAESSYSVSARQRNLLWADNATPTSFDDLASKDIPSRTPMQLDVIPKETRADVATETVERQELAVGNKANLSEAYHRFTSSNVTFLMCTELGKPVPTPQDGQSFKGDPFVVAFLPEDPNRSLNEQTHLLQLTCRLLDVTRAEIRQEAAPTMATPVVLSAVPNFS